MLRGLSLSLVFLTLTACNGGGGSGTDGDDNLGSNNNAALQQLTKDFVITKSYEPLVGTITSIGLSPDGTKAIVATTDSGAPLTIVDLTLDKPAISSTIDVTELGFPSGTKPDVMLSPDGNYAIFIPDSTGRVNFNGEYHRTDYFVIADTSSVFSSGDITPVGRIFGVKPLNYYSNDLTFLDSTTVAITWDEGDFSYTEFFSLDDLQVFDSEITDLSTKAYERDDSVALSIFSELEQTDSTKRRFVISSPWHFSYLYEIDDSANWSLIDADNYRSLPYGMTSSALVTTLNNVLYDPYSKDGDSYFSKASITETSFYERQSVKIPTDIKTRPDHFIDYKDSKHIVMYGRDASSNDALALFDTTTGTFIADTSFEGTIHGLLGSNYIHQLMYPKVINGKVFIGGQQALNVYSLVDK